MNRRGFRPAETQAAPRRIPAAGVERGRVLADEPAVEDVRVRHLEVAARHRLRLRIVNPSRRVRNVRLHARVAERDAREHQAGAVPREGHLRARNQDQPYLPRACGCCRKGPASGTRLGLHFLRERGHRRGLERVDAQYLARGARARRFASQRVQCSL